MLFLLRNTKADSSANTPSPAVAVVFSPVLANCLSPLATVWEGFWATVFSTSTFLFSLLSSCPKIFRGSFWVVSFKTLFKSKAGSSSWIKASPLSSFLSDGAGVTGTGVFWFEAIVLLKIVYLLKWLVKNVSFPSL